MAQPDANNDAALKSTQQLLQGATSDKELFNLIVNDPFQDQVKAALLGLGIVVLLLVNKKTNTVERIALSDTEPAKGAVKVSIKPFKDIQIPFDFLDNLIVKAIRSQEPQRTIDWELLFTPELTAQEARFNQAGAGIACSFVYPLSARDGGALIFSYFKPLETIGDEQFNFMQSYCSLVAKQLSSQRTK